jgi:hypothetical protein
MSCLCCCSALSLSLSLSHVHKTYRQIDHESTNVLKTLSSFLLYKFNTTQRAITKRDCKRAVARRQAVDRRYCCRLEHCASIECRLSTLHDEILCYWCQNTINRNNLSIYTIGNWNVSFRLARRCRVPRTSSIESTI